MKLPLLSAGVWCVACLCLAGCPPVNQEAIVSGGDTVRRSDSAQDAPKHAEAESLSSAVLLPNDSTQLWAENYPATRGQASGQPTQTERWRYSMSADLAEDYDVERDMHLTYHQSACKGTALVSQTLDTLQWHLSSLSCEGNVVATDWLHYDADRSGAMSGEGYIYRTHGSCPDSNDLSGEACDVPWNPGSVSPIANSYCTVQEVEYGDRGQLTSFVLWCVWKCWLAHPHDMPACMGEGTYDFDAIRP